jgi:hypothetical protein
LELSEIAIPLIGLLATLLGAAFGAWLGGAAFWTGPVIVVAATVAQELVSEFVIAPLGHAHNFILDTVIYLAFVAIFAALLRVSANAAAAIVIGSMLARFLFAAVFLYGMRLFA